MPQQRVLTAWSAAIVVASWVVWVALVQAPERHYRVAVLTPGANYHGVTQGLQEELATRGYVDGTNLTLMVEEAPAAGPDLDRRTAQLVATHPDVLVTVGTAHATAAQRATTRVPIVFTLVADPLRAGLIASYTSSQNNLTGISTYATVLTGKRLELLQTLAPGTRRVLAVVATREAVALDAFQMLTESARKLGLQVLHHDVTTPEEIEHVLRDTPTGAVDAIFHVPSNLVGTHIGLLIEKANQERIPLMVSDDSMVNQGALVAYGANFRSLGRQTARLVVKVLKGARPAELPIQMLDQVLLTLNLSAARAIGLTIPRSFLERVDRVVE